MKDQRFKILRFWRCLILLPIGVGMIAPVAVAAQPTQNTAQVGELTVASPSPAQPVIDYSVLQFPTTVSVEAGALTPAIYGRVYEERVTEEAGAAPQVIAQLGYGKPGTDPRSDASWKWTDALYNVQVDNNDEYQATFKAPETPGRYAYTYRFALVQGGSTSAYTYADLDGSGTNPGLDFEPAKLGELTVTPPLPAQEVIDYSVLQFPATMNVEAGTSTPMIYGRVYEEGVTKEGGAAPQVIAQLGYGAPGTDPRSDASWKWTDALYNVQVDNNDEYQATFKAPETPGRYAYTYRFALVQGGSTSAYTYADLDGSGTNPGLEFDPVKLGELTVGSPPPTLSVIDETAPDCPRSGTAVRVPANLGWCNSRIMLSGEGERVIIIAEGRWSNSGAPTHGPDGIVGYNHPGSIAESVDLASLIARVDGKMIPVGSRHDEKNMQRGWLYFSINDVPGTFDDNQGFVDIDVHLRRE